MAIHRRPPGVEPPAGLFEFPLEEWQAPGDLDREPAFQRWAAARRAWIAEHPGSALGGMLDLLQVVSGGLGLGISAGTNLMCRGCGECDGYASASG